MTNTNAFFTVAIQRVSETLNKVYAKTLEEAQNKVNEYRTLFKVLNKKGYGIEGINFYISEVIGENETVIRTSNLDRETELYELFACYKDGQEAFLNCKRYRLELHELHKDKVLASERYNVRVWCFFHGKENKYMGTLNAGISVYEAKERLHAIEQIGKRYEVKKRLRWVNKETGQTASFHGAVPYTNEKEKDKWSVDVSLYTIYDTKQNTYGVYGLRHIDCTSKKEVDMLCRKLNLEHNVFIAKLNAYCNTCKRDTIHANDMTYGMYCTECHSLQADTEEEIEVAK